MEKQIAVAIHKPSIEYAPTAYIYRVALRQISQENTEGENYAEKAFFFVGESLVYHDSRYGQSALFTLADSPEIIAKTMGAFNTKMYDLFDNEPSFNDEDRENPDRLPLGKLSHYERPLFAETTAKDGYERGFVAYLKHIGSLCPTPKARFDLVSEIEDSYLPMRLLERVR